MKLIIILMATEKHLENELSKEKKSDLKHCDCKTCLPFPQQKHILAS